MKKAIIFGVGLIFTIFLAGCALPGQQPKQAALQISSSPKSTVFLDDKHVGQTPYYDEKLKPDEYIVKLAPEVEATMASSWSSKITLHSETLTVINRDFGNTPEESAGEILSLESIGANKSPEMAVITNPDKATIKLNGSLKGTSPLVITDIVPGDYDIEISVKNYLTRQLKVKVVKGYRLTANVDLAKNVGKKIEATASGDLTPTVTPKKTNITPTPEVEESVTPTISPSENQIKVGSKIKVTETPTGWLNVRPDASTDGSPSAQVNPGDQFKVIEIKPGWVRIEYEKGKDGWVSSDYILAL